MVVIVDYGLGNLFSVKKAFEHAGADVKITSGAEEIRAADRIVLPGVGAFGDGMEFLRAKGLDRVLTGEILGKKKPFFGICLGLQLLAEKGVEYGDHRGLEWIRGTVVKLTAASQGLKVPHIGWNTVTIARETPLLAGLKEPKDFYFVHSFHLECADESDLVATADYGGPVTAAIQRGNVFATQFHPEKSQENGLKLIENFLRWNP